MQSTIKAVRRLFFLFGLWSELLNMFLYVLGDLGINSILCHMKKITEDHIVQNILLKRLVVFLQNIFVK